MKKEKPFKKIILKQYLNYFCIAIDAKLTNVDLIKDNRKLKIS